MIAEEIVELLFTETIPPSNASVPLLRVLCSSICRVPERVMVFSSFKLPPEPFSTIDLLLPTVKASAIVKIFPDEIFIIDSPE